MSHDAPTKLGFLSLEFIIGDSTYWLTTGLGRDGFYFTTLPLALFGDAKLYTQLIDRERDYSEITVVEDAEKGYRGNLFCYAQGARAVWLDADLFAAPRLSWNEMIAVAMDAIPLADQCGLWHHHVVRKTDPAFLIPDVRYQVTAFLPPPGEGIFAIIGEDYKLPENPNFLTCNLPDDASFKARLRGFRVELLKLNGKFYPAL